MKFLPFDEDDFKRLDLLIRREEYANLGFSGKKARQDRWRAKIQREDPARWAKMLREKNENERRKRCSNPT